MDYKIFSWSGLGNPNYDTCHLDILKDKAFIYNNEQDVFNILLNLERKDIKDKNWDMYSENFNLTETRNPFPLGKG